MPRVVFFNVGWMREYRGLANDRIEGGGRFVDEEGYGHEMFNFYVDNGADGLVYGYVKSPGKHQKVNLVRLGGGATDESLDHVTVIWTARNPNGLGTRVVGWYRDATVYRDLQVLRNFLNPPSL